MSPKLSRKSGLLLSRIITLGAFLAILTGAALVGHPYYTDLLAAQEQERLGEVLESDGAREAFELNRFEESMPVTRLRIPRLNVDTVVVEGTSDEALRSGAGHYPGTSLPGGGGNIAIAGHRTTYGKPFADLDQLVPGDRVELDTPVGPFVYELIEPFDGHANPWVVEPDDWSVVGRSTEEVLTLTTCHPKRSDRQRLIARFALVGTPAGPLQG